MGRFILLRHGLEENPECLHGHQDVPLLPKGIEEAENAAQRLSGIHFKCAYTSDLTRAKATAEMVCAKQVVPLVPNPDPAIRSLNLGMLEGRPYTEIEQKFNSLWNEWMTNEDLKAPGGESFGEFQMRIYPFMFKMQEEARNADVLAVSHSHVCNYAAAMAMNCGRPLIGNSIKMMKQFDIKPGDAVEFVDGKITRLNFIRGN